MRSRTVLMGAIVSTLAGVLALSGCSGPDGPGTKSEGPGPSTRSQVGRSTLTHVEFDAGVTCTTARSSQGVGVSCDFSSVVGVDPVTLEDEAVKFPGGTAHLKGSKSELCVVAETAQAVSLDCHYA